MPSKTEELRALSKAMGDTARGVKAKSEGPLQCIPCGHRVRRDGVTEQADGTVVHNACGVALGRDPVAEAATAPAPARLESGNLARLVVRADETLNISVSNDDAPPAPAPPGSFDHPCGLGPRGPPVACTQEQFTFLPISRMYECKRCEWLIPEGSMGWQPPTKTTNAGVLMRVVQAVENLPDDLVVHAERHGAGWRVEIHIPGAP